MKKSIYLISCAVLLSAAITSCTNTKLDVKNQMERESQMTQEDEEPFVLVGGAKMVPSLDIIDNAVGSKDHTTLVEAVTAADLAGVLKSDGPFTVFAPTNAAFAKLPNGTVESLLEPENKNSLQTVLTYHVVAGSIKVGDLQNGQMLETVNGEKLKVSVKDGKVMINDALVTIPDVISSNGITHVVDAVMLPKRI